MLQVQKACERTLLHHSLGDCEAAVITAGDKFTELAEDDSDDDSAEDEALHQNALQDGTFTGGFVE